MDVAAKTRMQAIWASNANSLIWEAETHDQLKELECYVNQGVSNLRITPLQCLFLQQQLVAKKNILLVRDGVQRYNGPAYPAGMAYGGSSGVHQTGVGIAGCAHGEPVADCAGCRVGGKTQ